MIGDLSLPALIDTGATMSCMKDTTLTIRCLNDITILPLSELTVEALVQAPNDLLQTIGINMARLRPVPFVVKRALVRPSVDTNKVPITLFNGSRTSYKVNKDNVLAIYSLRREEDFMSEEDTACPGGAQVKTVSSMWVRT